MERWIPVEMKIYFIDGMIGVYWCDPDFKNEIFSHIFRKYGNEIIAIKWDGVFLANEIIKSNI